MILYRHRQTKEAKNMIIKKIGKFYYDENIRQYLFIMSNLKTNKQKLQFLSDMLNAINSISNKNECAKELLNTINSMYLAVLNNETIILAGE